MDTPYVWNRSPHRSHLRAADADRDRVADRLRTGHAEGRLDLAEFQQRLENCYDARTFGELDLLVRDLPPETHPVARTGGSSMRSWRWALLPVVALLLALMAMAGPHGHHPEFLLWVPFVFLLWRMGARRRRGWTTGQRPGAGGGL